MRALMLMGAMGLLASMGIGFAIDDEPQSGGDGPEDPVESTEDDETEDETENEDPVEESDSEGSDDEPSAA